MNMFCISTCLFYIPFLPSVSGSNWRKQFWIGRWLRQFTGFESKPIEASTGQTINDATMLWETEDKMPGRETHCVFTR